MLVHTNAKQIIMWERNLPPLKFVLMVRGNVMYLVSPDRLTFRFSTEMPYITLAPEDQTLKIGSYLVLECEATAEPRPKIWWKRNERPLNTSNRIFFGNENTELHIDHIKESDEGKLVVGVRVHEINFTITCANCRNLCLCR